MTNKSPTRLKIAAKRWLGRFVYFCYYAKNKFSSFIKKRNFSTLFSSSHLKLAHQRWKLIFYIISVFLICYYGIGAIISSRFNNQLETTFKANLIPGQYTVSALSHVIKTQVDDTAWTPALPVIFPASILDNLPNFQIGVKDSANFFISNLAKRSANAHLQQAADLLSYPADIWLFSQNKEDKLSPGTAKQYRKAIAELEHFIAEKKEIKTNSTQELLDLLKDINTLLNKKLSDINKHILEHNSEMTDFKADDLFYQTEGCVYSLHYLLSALVKDYKTQILQTDQYENLTIALRFLSQAAKIKPLIIKNASFIDSYTANHLAYLAYYLSQAQNKIQEIMYQISLNMLEQQSCTLNENS